MKVLIMEKIIAMPRTSIIQTNKQKTKKSTNNERQTEHVEFLGKNNIRLTRGKVVSAR